MLKIRSNSLRLFRNWRRGVCTVGADEPQFISDPSSSSAPWLMLSPRRRSDKTTYRLYNYAENRVSSLPRPDWARENRIVGSTHGWLVLFNHRRNGGELFLSNPLSGRRVNLPFINNLPIPEKNLRNGWGGCVEKLILSSPDPESADCRALMTFGMTNRLAFCSTASSSSSWTVIGAQFYETGFARYYQDLVHCPTQDLFFAVTYNDPELEAWDLRDPLSPKLVRSRRMRLPQNSYRRDAIVERKYLVASQGEDGELFYVRRYIKPPVDDGTRAWEDDESPPFKTIDFEVDKIGAGGEMTSTPMVDGHLDGRVLFLGGVSRGLATQQAPLGFPSDSICFTHDSGGVCAFAGGHDNGIFDYSNKTISSCYYPCLYQSPEKLVLKPPPLWFTPNPS